MSLGKASINLVVIKTNKIQEQFEFYSAIGVEFEYHKHGNGPYHYASVGVHPVVEIYPLPKGVLEPDNTTRLGFEVEDLDRVMQCLRTKGARSLQSP
ncbi:MAG: glyoxalase/bleomycin resistance/extradiol dioxygenase family protein [Chitinophagaceae bacterium]|nr:glyoxalase/bleomycin resistance/extradiol dioxygenase family protein [Chitinophagaceae bacterium]